jgi:hypothetical protein
MSDLEQDDIENQCEDETDDHEALESPPNEELKKEEPKPPQKEISVRQENKNAIGLDEKGLLAAKDSSEEWRVAQLMLSSKALPKQFENVAQVVMALQFLKAHGLNPMVSIRQTMIVNGSIAVYGELPLCLVQRSGELEDFEEFFVDKDYKEICFDNKNLEAEIYTAVCKIKRKNKKLITKTFTVQEAKKAALWDKDIWKKYPRRMLQMRTRSLALKDVFPDILSGIAISEYDFESSLESNLPRDILPEGKKNVAAELNEAFINEETEADKGSGSSSENKE